MSRHATQPHHDAIEGAGSVLYAHQHGRQRCINVGRFVSAGDMPDRRCHDGVLHALRVRFAMSGPFCGEAQTELRA